jgi:hypothetical protein
VSLLLATGKMMLTTTAELRQILTDAAGGMDVPDVNRQTRSIAGGRNGRLRRSYPSFRRFQLAIIIIIAHDNRADFFCYRFPRC